MLFSVKPMLKAQEPTLNWPQREDAVLSLITLNLLLLSSYQKYPFAWSNIHREHPEKYLIQHSTKNMECLCLDRASSELLVWTVLLWLLRNAFSEISNWHYASNLYWAIQFFKPHCHIHCKIVFGDTTQYIKVPNVWRTMDKILSPPSTWRVLLPAHEELSPLVSPYLHGLSG